LVVAAVSLPVSRIASSNQKSSRSIGFRGCMPALHTRSIFGTGDAGGSGLTFGGKLTNNGDLDIDNSGLTTAVTVTAAGSATPRPARSA
jgi:hypothetical protein